MELIKEKASKNFQFTFLKSDIFRRKKNLKFPSATKKLSRNIEMKQAKNRYSTSILNFC
jgi:hypothetical protein